MSIGKMTPEETERLKRLCKRILEEQDQQKFNELVMELNTLLASTERRLQPEQAQTTSQLASSGCVSLYQLALNLYNPALAFLDQKQKSLLGSYQLLPSLKAYSAFLLSTGTLART